jgi:hypothetical protein
MGDMAVHPSRPVLIASGISALAMLVTACFDAAPARLALESDTLIINSPRAVVIPVHAVDSDGGLIRRVRLTYASNAAVAHVWQDGRVACSGTGDATVTVAARALEAHVTVRCRPRLWLTLAPDLSGAASGERLWVGAPPRELSVIAYDSGDVPVHLPPGTATARVHHDSVARIIGSRVYALSSGRTSVDLEFDGASGGAMINVVERVVHDSLQLVGGERRSWRVPPGYYEMRLDLPRDAKPGQGLELAAYAANCAHAPRDEGQHYFCILKENSAIIVQNARPRGAHSERSGKLTVFRLP